jgi:ATP-dependent DNA helicase RecG
VKHDLLQRLHLRIDADMLDHPAGRVVVFTVPPRPIGLPVEVDGAYWMRSGESLVKMTPDQLKRIFDEGTPDFSATICAGLTLADLAPDAIDRFRSLWCYVARPEAAKRTARCTTVGRS